MSNFWKHKLVLVTGANGFLGSHLSISLLKEGASIIGIIKEDPKDSYLKIALKQISGHRSGAPRTKVWGSLPEAKSIPQIPISGLKPGDFAEGIKLIKSDIADFHSTLNIFKRYKPDVCLHVAAQPIVGIANKSPLPTFESNIKGTWNILEIDRLCLTKAVVVASSDKAYGEHKKLPYKEETALQALHPYDSSKACTDILTRCYAHTYGLRTAVTRCANIYGPGDFNFSRIIPDTMRSLLLNKNPVIRSDGTPLRDYIFIEDVVNAYLLLARKIYEGQISPGEAFNFGTGRPISVLSLVQRILSIARRSDLRPEILIKTKIKGEIDKQYLSSSKAKKILGWRCQTSLENGLRKTFAWYSNHLQCQSR